MLFRCILRKKNSYGSVLVSVNVLCLFALLTINDVSFFVVQLAMPSRKALIIRFLRKKSQHLMMIMKKRLISVKDP